MKNVLIIFSSMLLIVSSDSSNNKQKVLLIAYSRNSDTTKFGNPLQRQPVPSVTQSRSFTDEFTIKIIVFAGAAVSGILAFCGTLLGARINRKTQHQTWLSERRAEAFAEFLKR